MREQVQLSGRERTEWLVSLTSREKSQGAWGNEVWEKALRDGDPCFNCEILTVHPRVRALRREHAGEVLGRQAETILLRSPAARFCSSVDRRQGCRLQG